MEVYVVETIDRVDGEVSSCIEVFSTEEKAKEYFQKKAKENKQLWSDNYNEDIIIFSRGKNYFSIFLDGYSFENSFDMTITKQEIQ